MTRKRVTASEKKQRHEWAIRQIDAGMGLSELTAFTCHGLLVQIRLAFLETPVPQWLLLVYDLVLGERLRRMACRGSGVRVSLAPFSKKVSPALASERSTRAAFLMPNR